MSDTSISRPKVTAEIVKAAANRLIQECGLEGSADEICSVYREGMDGYAIGKELDLRFGWDIDADSVEHLDGLGFIVHELHTKACYEWVSKNNIHPKLAIGTTIQRGVICGVSEYNPAMYKVKEHGCNKEDRFLLIKFEAAENNI